VRDTGGGNEVGSSNANFPFSSPILSHTYTGRPLSATHLLPLYLDHPAPRPSLIYLPNTNPQTLVFSLSHANLLFLLTASSELEPLLALEFLHRIVDVLEDFLGSPLLATKIESNYDVVAQLLTEMCDAGTIGTTEPNALRDLVEVEGFMGKLLGNLSLPGYVLNLVTSSLAHLAPRATNVILRL
jgi:AP-3 complex subunit mu